VTGEPFRLGYRPPLDGLRAVAVLAVLGFHALPLTINGGYLGVDVFFVLSGFLITALLVQERDVHGRISLADFYRRRALRLLPALVVLLVAASIYGAVYPHRIENATIVRDVVGTALYVANWVAALHHRFELRLLSHTWSLSIEEQFYLLWPITLGFLLRRRLPRAQVVGIVLVGVIASADLRHLLYVHHAPGPRITYGLDTRGGALLLGCALALVVSWRMLPGGRLTTVAAGLAAVAGMAGLLALFLASRYGSVGIALHPRREWDEAYLAVSLASAAVILGVVVAPRSPVAWLLSRPPLVAVGRVSYGLYLWHYPVDVVLTPQRTGLTSFENQLLRLAVSATVTTGSWFLVERPFLRRKARISRAALEGVDQVHGDVLHDDVVPPVLLHPVIHHHVAEGAGRRDP
jgi:peptidoglycan/LPS O-acetylase OafA/YrhL